jgi:hypothetical protein
MSSQVAMTALFKPPLFTRQVACITDDAALAATLSSLVGDEGEYVSVLEAPRMGRPNPHNEVVRRCNGIAKLWPKTVLLAGLSKEAVAGFTAIIGHSANVRQAENAGDVRAAVGAARRSGLDGEIHCGLAEIGPALLLAKRVRKLLVVDESTPPLPKLNSVPLDHVVVLDDHDGMAQVIAANYAYSIGADLVLIPQRDDTLRDDVYAEIDACGAYRGEDRGASASKCLQTMRSVLEPALQFGPRKFVTFITRGIPYGYFYRDAPSTHLFSYPNLGEVINAGIYWATDEPFTSAAVLIDPGHFTPSETPAVSASLKSDGVCVFEVLGDHANFENARLFLEAFPYDLLFICSHCGEVGGERLTVRTRDAAGVIHTIVVEEVVQFGSTMFGSKPDKEVQVLQLLRPVSVDGVAWHAGQAPERLRGWEALHETPREQWEVLRRENVEHVPYSTAIKLKQGALMLSLMHVIDPRVSPIIFTNSCVSFYDAAHTLTFAGARAYVGTLTPVGISAAQQIAEAIFVDPQRAESLPLVLNKAQEQVFSDPDDRTYVHVGCHFTAIRRPPPGVAGARLGQRIRHAIDEWRSHLNHANARMKENILEFIRFLSIFDGRQQPDQNAKYSRQEYQG